MINHLLGYQNSWAHMNLSVPYDAGISKKGIRDQPGPIKDISQGYNCREWGKREVKVGYSRLNVVPF